MLNKRKHPPVKDIPPEKLDKIYREYIDSMGLPTEADLARIDATLAKEEKKKKTAGK